jgi:hypothetical protein
MPVCYSSNQIYDRYNTSMAYYPEVPSILLQLHRSRVHVAAASRTSAPKAQVYSHSSSLGVAHDSLACPQSSTGTYGTARPWIAQLHRRRPDDPPAIEGRA